MSGALAGRRALVTGGASGIGRAIALALAAEGARVAIADRVPAERIEEVVATISGRGGEAFAVQADVAEEAQVLALFEHRARPGSAASTSWSTTPAS